MTSRTALWRPRYYSTTLREITTEIIRVNSGWKVCGTAMHQWLRLTDIYLGLHCIQCYRNMWRCKERWLYSKRHLGGKTRSNVFAVVSVYIEQSIDLIKASNNIGFELMSPRILVTCVFSETRSSSKVHRRAGFQPRPWPPDAQRDDRTTIWPVGRIGSCPPFPV